MLGNQRNFEKYLFELAQGLDCLMPFAFTSKPDIITHLLPRWAIWCGMASAATPATLVIENHRADLGFKSKSQYTALGIAGNGRTAKWTFTVFRLSRVDP
jgi:hypothetical protein